MKHFLSPSPFLFRLKCDRFDQVYKKQLCPLSDTDGTDGGTSNAPESVSENSSMVDLKNHSGSVTSMNSLSTISSGIGSVVTVSDHPDKIEVLKQKKESMEEGIKKYEF